MTVRKSFSSCLGMARALRFFVLLCAWLPAAQAAAISCGEQPIRLAFYDYGLFHFTKNHQEQGIDKEIVDELSRRSGCRFETVVMARARIWAELANGGLDMSVSGIQTAERDRFAWFAPYLSMKNYAIVHRDLLGRVRSGASFVAQPALRIGVVRAFRHGREQDEWLEILRGLQRVEESPDVDSLFRKLKDRRIDTLFSQPPVYGKLLRDHEMQGMVAIQDWTPKEKGVLHGLILAKSRFAESEAQRWRQIIDDMRNDGSLRRIYERYLSPAEAAVLLDF